MPPSHSIGEALYVADRRCIDIWHRSSELDVTTVTGPIDRPTDRADARLKKRPEVGKPLVAKGVEFVDGDDVGWQPLDSTWSCIVRPTQRVLLMVTR